MSRLQMLLLSSLLFVSCQTGVVKISLSKPEKYRVVGEVVEGMDCELGLLKGLDFHRAVRNAREKTAPMADGLIDVEIVRFWNGAMGSNHCIIVRGIPVILE